VVVSKIDDKQMIFKGFRYNNLYLVDFTSEEANLITCLFTKTSLGWLWYRRLAHIGMNNLNKLLKKELVKGLKDVKFEKDKPCTALLGLLKPYDHMPLTAQMRITSLFPSTALLSLMTMRLVVQDQPPTQTQPWWLSLRG
jgi:hypothetical protein